MATTLKVLANKVSADHTYASYPADYVEMVLLDDYFIWSKGGTGVADGDDEPTENELNENATVIHPDNDVTIAKCFVFDKSEGTGTIRLLDGMALNKRYVFGFSFDGATASEPQLEAWDDSDHDSTDFHVLGNGTPANSWLKGVCTTDDLPGASWVGSVIAGANVLLLNNGNGALGDLASGETSQELYCNLKVVIPAGYATPAVEPWVTTIRFSWN